jgi:hypothetical protein
VFIQQSKALKTTKQSRKQKPVTENPVHQKTEPQRKKKSKRETVSYLTIEEQLTTFAEIIVSNLFNDVTL